VIIGSLHTKTHLARGIRPMRDRTPTRGKLYRRGSPDRNEAAQAVHPLKSLVGIPRLNDPPQRLYG
jgi:hypothetical protein